MAVVWLLGAGASAPAGAPTLWDFLTPDVVRDAPVRSTEIVREFMEDQRIPYDPDDERLKHPPIQEAWAACDEALIGQRSAGGRSARDLRSLQRAILTVHNGVIASCHRRIVEALEDVRLPLWNAPYAQSSIESVRAFLESPEEWAKDQLLRELTPEKQVLGQVLLSHAVNTPDSRDARNRHERQAVDTIARVCTRVYEIPTKDGQPPSAMFDAAGLLWKKLSGDTGRRITEDDFWLSLRGRLLHDNPGDFLLIPQGHHNEERRGDRWLDLLWAARRCSANGAQLRSLAGFFDVYYDLVKRLSRGDAVVTTNYDLFVETAWTLAASDIRQPFRVLEFGTRVRRYSGGRHFPNMMPGSFPDALDMAGADRIAEERLVRAPRWLPLLKVHGSIDLAECPGRIHRWQSWLEPWATVGAIRRFCDCPPRRGRPSSFRQVLIPPQELKDYAAAPLAEIADAARGVFSVTNTVAVMGHALASVDTHLLGVVRLALADRDGKPWTVHIIDKKPGGPSQRARRWFGESGAQHKCSTNRHRDVAVS